MLECQSSKLTGVRSPGLCLELCCHQRCTVWYTQYLYEDLYAIVLPGKNLNFEPWMFLFVTTPRAPLKFSSNFCREAKDNLHNTMKLRKIYAIRLPWKKIFILSPECSYTSPHPGLPWTLLHSPPPPPSFWREPKDVLFDIYNTSMKLRKIYSIGLPRKNLYFEPWKFLFITTPYLPGKSQY